MFDRLRPSEFCRSSASLEPCLIWTSVSRFAVLASVNHHVVGVRASPSDLAVHLCRPRRPKLEHRSSSRQSHPPYLDRTHISSPRPEQATTGVRRRRHWLELSFSFCCLAFFFIPFLSCGSSSSLVLRVCFVRSPSLGISKLRLRPPARPLDVTG